MAEVQQGQQNVPIPMPVSLRRTLIKVDKQITKNLNEAGITTRESTSNGLWCCLLLPCILINYTCILTVSRVYNVVAFVSVGLLCYMILFSIFVFITSSVLKENSWSGCTASSMVAVLLIYGFLEIDLTASIVIAVIPVIANYFLIRYILRHFPKTFTLGEAFIVCQGSVLVAAMALAEFFLGTNKDFINITVFTVLFGVLCMVIALTELREDEKTLKALGHILAAGSCGILLLLHIMLGRRFLLDFIIFVFQYKRSKLITFWMTLVILSMLLLCFQAQRGLKAGTAMRKSFHLLASGVFLSGTLDDVEFMKLAAGLVFSVLIFIEALRLSDIQPISGSLQSAFDMYCDEKDQGCFAVSPIYLYVGLACPLFLVPPHQGHTVELLAGVLAIGVGDSAASCFGSHFGYNKWPGSNRTIEGTASNVISQVLTIYLLYYFDYITSAKLLPRATIAAVVSSYVESCTDQVDNLVLPLVTIITLQFTLLL